MVELYARQLFCRFFYKKNKSAARSFYGAGFYFIYFARKKTPTADRRHSI